MRKVLEVLAIGKNQQLLIELRDWINKEHPEIDMRLFLSSPFPMQLGVFLIFFEMKNIEILANSNSYTIGYVNPTLTIESERDTTEALKVKGNPFLIEKYDLKINDVLQAHQLAMLDAIQILNKPVF